jgi:hypothetical protein
MMPQRENLFGGKDVRHIVEPRHESEGDAGQVGPNTPMLPPVGPDVRGSLQLRCEGHAGMLAGFRFDVMLVRYIAAAVTRIAYSTHSFWLSHIPSM